MENQLKLGKASLNFIDATNPWALPVDRLEYDKTDYYSTVEACRFFYEHDPIASSTINKLVEIGINELRFKRNALTANEFRIFQGIKESLQEFAEAMALEYLISGLVIPEVKYSRVGKNRLTMLGIKNYSSLILPTSFWLRNVDDIKINSALPDEPSYFYKVPNEIKYFIQNNGKFSDGTADPVLFAKLKTEFSEFFQAVKGNQDYFLLDNPNIFRRNPRSNDPYPIPFLKAALEDLKHKRNLRRMDYSIASRVISAIQLFTLGNDEYPLTEDTADEQISALRQQIYYRDGRGTDVERIFQLFGNHTLKITWVYPPVDALLNDAKYRDINQDIIFALGFPRVLITGESERTGSSDPQYAMMAPARTMESFRSKIIRVIKNIVFEVARLNDLKTAPTPYFKPLRLFDHQILLRSLADLYAGGNISRTTYAEELGYDWPAEMDLREDEKQILLDKNLEEFAPKPYSKLPVSDINKENNNPEGVNK